jgi:SMODS and SLOG-associating 2TM effector domain 1
VCATLAAALLSAVGGALGGAVLSVWVGVATTVASALAAHIASEQHARIAAGYAQTADQLDRLLRRFDPTHSDEQTAASFVADVEQVLSAQNGSWAMITKGGR